MKTYLLIGWLGKTYFVLGGHEEKEPIIPQSGSYDKYSVLICYDGIATKIINLVE